MNRTLHICWFGGKPKGKLIQNCMASWKRYLDGFEIREWNEDNFDVKSCLYAAQAYEYKMYAFVADYARFYILDRYGGLYLDTDVELVKSLNPLLEQEAFAGFETDTQVAPGLALYAREPGQPVIREVREWYEAARFLDERGQRIRKNVVNIFTEALERRGFVPDGSLQTCGGVTLYPREYFCPFDDATGILARTENTYAIHWYAKSWVSPGKIFRNRISRILHRAFGTDIRERMERTLGQKLP